MTQILHGFYLLIFELVTQLRENGLIKDKQTANKKNSSTGKIM